MNFATFERAQVAAFAYREAGHTGSLDCLKAVCYVLRNRVRAGWGDGSWLSVIEFADEGSGNAASVHQELKGTNRLLQLIVRDIDDIYLSQERFDDDAKTVVQDALYYAFIDRDIRPNFALKVVRDPENHPRIAQVGPMMLYK